MLNNGIGQSRPCAGTQYSFGLEPLCSQSLYMAFNGTPYDANMLLNSVGPFAWVVIGIELLVWGFLAFAIGGKFVNRFNVPTQEITSQESVSPQA